MQHCINCGRKITKQSVFCPYCGAKLRNTKKNNKKLSIIFNIFFAIALSIIVFIYGTHEYNYPKKSTPEFLSVMCKYITNNSSKTHYRYYAKYDNMCYHFSNHSRLVIVKAPGHKSQKFHISSVSYPDNNSNKIILKGYNNSTKLLAIFSNKEPGFYKYCRTRITP